MLLTLFYATEKDSGMIRSRQQQPDDVVEQKPKKHTQSRKTVVTKPTTLLEAVLVGDISVLRKLSSEANNMADSDTDDLALLMAARMGSLEMVSLLLAAGVDPVGYNNAPLRAAEDGEHDDVVALLRKQPGVGVAVVDVSAAVDALIDY